LVNSAATELAILGRKNQQLALLNQYSHVTIQLRAGNAPSYIQATCMAGAGSQGKQQNINHLPETLQGDLPNG
jgi:hypothetical protein